MDLAADLKDEIALRVRSGAYQSEDEVIRRALEQLRKYECWLAEVRAKVDEARASSARGEMYSPEDVREYFRKKAEAPACAGSRV